MPHLEGLAHIKADAVHHGAAASETPYESSDQDHQQDPLPPPLSAE
jgi:hypothetical protein|tara:strand:+ start:476 stop:613 length:138 start_codon:yes stop_codon:yes gene_type:complete